MKYYLHLLLFLPLCNSAQNLPYDTPAFKAIEKKLKINKRQVYWDFYTKQNIQSDSLHQLIAFPLLKREQGSIKLDLYVINYNLVKQKIEAYYKGENQWIINEDNSLRGLEIVPRTQILDNKNTTYQLRAFFSNSLRYNPIGREELIWLIPKGKNLQNIFTANVMSYSGKIEETKIRNGNIHCNGNKEEFTSHFDISSKKIQGFYTLIEQRTTKKIQIIPDAEGFCTEEILNQQKTIIEWQYNKKEKQFKPN